MKIAPVVGAYQMIPHPQGVFVPDHAKDVRAAFALPALHVLVPDIGDEIGQTAFAAPIAVGLRRLGQFSILFPGEQEVLVLIQISHELSKRLFAAGDLDAG